MALKKTNLNNKGYWMLNLLRKKIDVRKRDNSIWVYGAWLGDKYADNTKYLFEYMNKNHKDIRSVWISNKEDIVNFIRNKGYEAYLSESEEGKSLRRKAGVALFTNSIMDLGNTDLCTGAYKVALWHGMPLKRIYLADNRNVNENKIKKYLKEIKRKAYSDVERSLSISTSKLTQNHVSKTFGVKLEDAPITGQPRTDMFLQNIELSISKVINVAGIEEIEKNKSKIICYMPTYRSNPKNEKVLDNIINNMVNDKRLNDLLEKNNYYLVIKGHYLLNTNSTKNNRVMFVNDSNISCTQELLNISDMLMTDYSSVFIDYLILKRPVIFLVPDLEDYEKFENGLNENYNELLQNGYAKDANDFINSLEEAITNRSKYVNESIRLNNIFNTALMNNSSYSENVYEEIKNRL